jgi:hypothetical protein
MSTPDGSGYGLRWQRPGGSPVAPAIGTCHVALYHHAALLLYRLRAFCIGLEPFSLKRREDNVRWMVLCARFDTRGLYG